MELAGSDVRGSSLELFTAARSVTEKTGGQVIAVILGSGTDAAVQTVSRYAPDAVIRIDDEQFSDYSNRRFTNALYALIQKYSPDAVMISATRNGKDLASRLARRLATGITANCCELSVESESGLIAWNMPAPGGIMATILCSDTRPQMGTICPGAFSRPVPGEVRAVELLEETSDAVSDDAIRLVRRVANPIDNELSITEADIIVGGGRGLGSADGFAPVRELAAVLGGAVGATRSVVDAGWIDPKHLIGQTGKLVRPKLYIACGISGALQHMVGVSEAQCIVAINRDVSAPIVAAADYVIVGDVKTILPALIDALK